jgi:tetratricopeptide (TPR) repeat protein
MDFRRPIGKDCMFCHNGYPAADPVASNTSDGAVFQSDLPEGIDCQRCHGPGAAHVKAAKSWRSKPEEIAASILNPADLPRERQLDVCRQCHLETTSLTLPNAIRRYDRGAYSFRPGESLTDFQLYFDHKAGTGFEDRLEVAHQAYRLEKSKCFLKSQMTCTTCHDPHMARRGEDASKHYIQACEGCHQSAHPQLASGPKVNADSNCMECHMWKRRTDDVVHVVMTDHFIQRFKPKRDLVAPIKETIPEYHGQVEPYYPRLLAEMPQGVLYNAVAQVAADSNSDAGVPLLRSVLEQVRPKQAGFYFALAGAYVRLQRDADSIRWFEEALKQSDASSVDKRELAIALMHTGEHERAIAMAQQAVAEQPTDLVALMNLANIYLQSGRIQDAREAAEKALAVNGDLADANNILGLVLVRERRPQEAQAAFRKALTTDPDLAEARVNLATSLAEQGDIVQAKQELEDVVKENPLSAEIRRKYAMVLAGGRHYDEAVDQIKQAIKLQQNSGYLVDMGDLLVAGGHVDQAVTYYRQAERLDPGQVRAYMGLASILMAQNKTVDAEREYQLAAAASPQNGEAQLALADIAMRRGDVGEVRHRLQLASQSDDPGAREIANKSLRGNP